MAPPALKPPARARRVRALIRGRRTALTEHAIAELFRAGSELVRITVNTEGAAAAVPAIMDRLAMMSCDVPVVGDFHYNGHQLLQQVPECARDRSAKSDWTGFVWPTGRKSDSIQPNVAGTQNRSRHSDRGLTYFHDERTDI